MYSTYLEVGQECVGWQVDNGLVPLVALVSVLGPHGSTQPVGILQLEHDITSQYSVIQTLVHNTTSLY